MDKHVGVKEEASADAIAERKNDFFSSDKTKWERLWPVIACGAGLFSDGYLQAVIGPVNTILLQLYPQKYANSAAARDEYQERRRREQSRPATIGRRRSARALAEIGKEAIELLS